MPDKKLLLPEVLLAGTAGPVLREYRVISQITQKAMAEQLQARPDTLSAYERGHCGLPASLMIRYAEALGMSVVLFDTREFGLSYPEHVVLSPGDDQE